MIKDAITEKWTERRKDLMDEMDHDAQVSSQRFLSGCLVELALCAKDIGITLPELELPFNLPTE